MKCKTCGASLDEEALFCSKCGAILAPSPRGSVIRLGKLRAELSECPVCGAYNGKDGAFCCEGCGRSGICLKHQDPETYLCQDCEVARRPGSLRRDGDRIFIRLNEQQEMAFVRIPAGEFLMGSDPKIDTIAFDYEQPQHRVSLPEYWLGLAPVTIAQYAAYISAVRGFGPVGWKFNRPPQDKLDHPVVNVNWHDAVAYCAWLSKLTGRQVALPTEAEWEKAARGTDGRIYPWGGQKPDEEHCNFEWSVKDTTPVGRYSPLGDSPYGCVDMAGNVYEWCADWFDVNYYARSPVTSPAGPEGGVHRVARGGSWAIDSWDVRATCRDGGDPGFYYDNQGSVAAFAQHPEEACFFNFCHSGC